MASFPYSYPNSVYRRAKQANASSSAGVRRPKLPERSPADKAVWLTFREASVVLHVPNTYQPFKASWELAVKGSASNDGDGLELRARPRVKAFSSTNKPFWCVHRDDIEAVRPAPRRPDEAWPAVPDGWLILNGALTAAGNDVDRVAFEGVWWRCLKAARSGSPLELNGTVVEMRRFAVEGYERWLVHSGSVPAMATEASLRVGRRPLPKRPQPPAVPSDNRYVPASRVLDGTFGDARSLVGILLTSMAESGSPLPGHDATGGPHVRRFMIGDTATHCIRADVVPAFLSAVRKLYDDQIAREIDENGEASENALAF